MIFHLSKQFPKIILIVLLAELLHISYKLIIMATLHSRCEHYIFVLFLFSFFLLFSSSNLSGRRLDVYHTSTNGVALAQI